MNFPEMMVGRAARGVVGGVGRLAMLAWLTGCVGPLRREVAVRRFDDHPVEVGAHYRWATQVMSLDAQTMRLRDFWEDHKNEKGAEVQKLATLAANQLVKNYLRLHRMDQVKFVDQWRHANELREDVSQS